MTHQPRPWSPPVDVQFTLHPKRRLIVEGIHVGLTDAEAKILLFLMAQPGTEFSSGQIVDGVHGYRADGGPECWVTVRTQILRAKKAFRAAGMMLNLKAYAGQKKYVYHSRSIVLLPDTRREVEQRRAGLEALHDQPGEMVGEQAVVAEPPPTEDAPRNRRVGRPRGKKSFVDLNPYVSDHEGTGNWTFPRRVEEEKWRRRQD